MRYNTTVGRGRDGGVGLTYMRSAFSELRSAHEGCGMWHTMIAFHIDIVNTSYINPCSILVVPIVIVRSYMSQMHTLLTESRWYRRHRRNRMAWHTHGHVEGRRLRGVEGLLRSRSRGGTNRATLAGRWAIGSKALGSVRHTQRGLTS